MSDIGDSRRLTELRVRAITIGVNLSWIVIGLLVFESIRLGVLTEPPARAAAIGVGLMPAALNFIKWNEMIDRPIGRLILWLWGATMLVVLAVALTVEELVPATVGLYLGLIVFGAVIGTTRILIGITVVAIASFLLIPVLGGDQTVGNMAAPVVAVVAVAIVTRMTIIDLAGSLSQLAWQQEELARKDVIFERLYEVSRTSSTGDNLDNVVPELVAGIGKYLDCDIAVVLLRDETGTSLEVMSPIWAAGHSLEIAGYRIGLQTRDPLVTASITNKPTIITDIDLDPLEQGLLGELGVANAMVVSIGVKRHSMGLMVVGDKRSGPFTESDLEDFVSLAAPTALVLSQLDRYKEAEETSRRLQDLAKLKTDFVSVVSHELRTPLTSIIGALATLARPELAPEREAARELLASARTQTDRLRRLIEDLLMVSRIENRSLPQNPVVIELRSLIASVIADVPDATGSVSVKVHDGVLKIEADSDHLHRILINLVQNAMKYGGGTEIEVIATPRAGGQISIAVLDHGPGITEAQRKAVFDRFTQLEPSATRSQGGTGLGLHIVNGLVEGMGGHIELVETPGGGATFYVVLPRAPGSLPVTTI